MVFLPHFVIEFRRFFINWSIIRFSFSVSHHWLGGFLSAIWFFKTHQLLHGARMFLLVSRFSSSVFIGLEDFSPGSHSLPTIPRLAELASEERGNCNNVIFEVEVMWQLLTTTSCHPVWLLSQRLVRPHLCYRVGVMSAYKLEKYPIAMEMY